MNFSLKNPLRLVQGQKQLVPKIEWGFEDEYKLVGEMIAHSVLQGGPGFAFIHPAIYRMAGNFRGV